MALNHVALNARALRGPSMCAHLLCELSNLSVDVSAVQETHFTCNADCRVLSSVEVSLLIERGLNADVNLILSDDEGRLIVADVAVGTFNGNISYNQPALVIWKALCGIPFAGSFTAKVSTFADDITVFWVYAPNIATERISFFDC